MTTRTRKNSKPAPKLSKTQKRVNELVALQQQESQKLQEIKQSLERGKQAAQQLALRLANRAAVIAELQQLEADDG